MENRNSKIGDDFDKDSVIHCRLPYKIKMCVLPNIGIRGIAIDYVAMSCLVILF